MDGFFRELRRRNVFRVAGVYAVVGWLLAQVSGTLESALTLPGWFDTVIVSALLIGFPIALVLAWAFEMTPEGVKLTANVPEAESIAPKTGRKLEYAILAGIGLIAVMFFVDRMTPENAATGSRDDLGTPTPISAASIAVLPFADLSPAKDQEYFSDGIAEEILNVLARTDGLKVASRTSSFQFRKITVGIPAIAKALSVRHILEGSVRRAGDTVRITAQLIDAQTDAHLWSQTFDRPLTTATIFATQDEIANAVLRALDSVLKKKAPTPKIAVAPPTNDTDAYELFLRAHRLFIDRGVGLREAVLLYERAVKSDPNFVRAWGELAAAASVAPAWDVIDRDYREIASRAAERAIALDPDQALPYAAQGQILLQLAFPPDLDRAREKLDKALTLAPNNVVALTWRSTIDSFTGNTEQAIKGFHHCMDIDPDYPLCQYNLALTAYTRGDKTQALDRFARLVLKGFSTDELHFLRPLLEKGDSVGAATVAIAGAKDRILAAELMAALDEKTPEAQMQALLRLRASPSVKGRLKNYLALQTALKQPLTDYELFVRSGMDYVWFPDYAAFRHTANFKKLAIAMGMHSYWRKHGFPPQCKPLGADDFECN